MAREATFNFNGKEITFRALDLGKVRETTKVLVEGRCVYAINARGELFSTEVRGNNLYFGNKVTHYSLKMMSAAAALGVLDKATVDKLKAEHDRLDNLRARASYARDTLDAAESAGLTLTKGQLQKLKAQIAAVPKEDR